MPTAPAPLFRDPIYGTRLFLLILLCLTGCQPLQPPRLPRNSAVPATPMPTAGVTLAPEGFIQHIHDPVLAKEGATYYVFSTGSRLIIICSPDLVTWEWCGRIFERNPAWVNEAVPGVGDLWAPDIAFFAGKWHLYYAASTFGSNRSVIGLATNVTLDQDSPDYAWVDEGLVIASQPGDNWNAIDANVAFDEKGQPWLAFGSYWSGIKLRKLDPVTGKLATDDETLYPLAQRFTADGSIEGAFIVRRGEYFYLFVSFDYCCRGVESTYNVRVGRAKQISGPYVDRDGQAMREGGGTLILSAYDRWRGPGHNGIFVENATYWIVYHAYDAKQVGIPKLRIESLNWDTEGWPSVPSQSNSSNQ
jgi:arabinan endo-1,5-alpha-L-arabinosidase